MMRAVTTLAMLCAAVAARAAHAGLEPGPAEMLPSGILSVATTASGPRHVLVAEKASQRLFVYEFEGDRAELSRVLPCTTGRVAGDKQREGDLKTPEGAYWFDARIPGSELPPLYGAGALVMDYPNHFDRLEGKTGSGIWLHGVETNERASVANDTRGCVAVRNDHFAQIRRLVRLNDTPILVVEKLDLVPREQLAREAAGVADFVERWRKAWEAKDMTAYLSFYGDDFRSGRLDKPAWSRQKRAVAAAEGARTIRISGLTMLRDKDRVWVTFRQEYASPRLVDVGEKSLFIKGSGSRWRIVGETWERGDELPAAPTPDALIASSARPPQPEAAATAAEPDARPSIAEPVGGPVEIETAARASDTPPAAEALPAAPAPAPTPAASEALPAVPAPAARARPQINTSPARIARGPLRLASSHALIQGDAVVATCQILSGMPTMTRSGTLIVSRAAPGGSLELTRDRFSVRQGLDVQQRLALAELPVTLRIVIEDESGRMVLDQDVVVSLEGT